VVLDDDVMLLGSLVPTFRRNILPLSRKYRGQSAIPRGIVTEEIIIKICSVTVILTTLQGTRNLENISHNTEMNFISNTKKWFGI